MKNYHWESVPRKVRDHVGELVDDLRGAAEDDLVGVLVHGSAARGEFEPERSDVDLIVVLARAPREILDKMGNALAVARGTARIEAMILVESEIARAADVFPLFYEDIKAFHALVYGRDPFADLVVPTEHRWLRIEQELRETQIRLRRAVTDARGDRRVLAGAIERKLKQLRFPLRALLELLGVAASEKLDIVVGKAAKKFKVDAAPFLRVEAHPLEAHAALVTLLDHAIEAADTLGVDVPRSVRGEG